MIISNALGQYVAAHQTHAPLSPCRCHTRQGQDLVSRIESIRTAHRRITDRDLPWQEAARRLERFGDCMQDADDVIPQWAARVLAVLLEGSYTDKAIRAVIRHAVVTGSLAGLDADVIDEADWEDVESLLPRAADAGVAACLALNL